MRYDKGSIIKKQNIKFADTGKLDFRMGGHPVVLMLDVEDRQMEEYIYFLTMSSRDDLYFSDPDRYYLLRKDNQNKLKKTSIVDLKHIYKDKNTNIPYSGILRIEDYLDMIKKLQKYQNEVICDLYNEIKKQLENIK